MYELEQFGIQPSVVFIEKWIASNEKYNVNACCEEISNVSNGNSSPPQLGMGSLTTELQKLIDEPESAARLLLDVRRSKSDEQMTEETQSSSSFSDESSQSIQTCYEIAGYNKRQATIDPASCSTIFELGHLLYNEYHRRENEIRNDDSDIGAISERNWPTADYDISQNVPANGANSPSNRHVLDFVDGTHHPLNSHDESIQVQDEEMPIDYSMTPAAGQRWGTSPAATLRSGFGDDRDFQFPEKFQVDARTSQIGLHCPAPQIPNSAFHRVSSAVSNNLLDSVYVPMMDNRHLSKADNIQDNERNGAAKSTSGTLVETVEANTQTGAEKSNNNLRDFMDYNVTMFSYFLCSLMNQRENVNSLTLSNAMPPSNRQDCSNQGTITQSNELQTRTNFGGKRKKRFRDQKRRATVAHETDACEPSKRMKKVKDSESEKRFDVENLGNPKIQPMGEEWLDIVPRKIHFKSAKLMYAETPKRLSRYMRRNTFSVLENN